MLYHATKDKPNIMIPQGLSPEDTEARTVRLPLEVQALMKTAVSSKKPDEKPPEKQKEKK